MVRRVVTRGLAGAMTMLLVASVSACSDDSGFEEVVLPGESPGPAPEISPTPGLSPAEAAAAAEILAVYEGFRELEIELYGDPDAATAGLTESITPRLRAYLQPPLLDSVGNEVVSMYHFDLARVGRPSWEPAVAEVRLDDDPRPSATVRDCFDATEWSFVDAATGDPIAYDDLPWEVSPAPERQVWELTAVFYDDLDPEGWRIERGVRPEGEQC